MTMPKPSNKSARMTRGKTAAIQASRDRTKAQTAPGADYKAEQAKKKAGSGGMAVKKYSSGEDQKKKRKDRLAKLVSMTAELRAKRKARSTMPTFGAK